MNRIIVLSLLLTLLPGVLTVRADEAQQTAIEQLRQNKGAVRAIASNDDRLLVDFHLSGEGFEDGALAPAAKLSIVYEIHLGGTPLTDVGLAHVAGLTSTERLHLQRTRITDDGLKLIRGFENLKYLNLYGTQITDAGLEHLGGLKSLRKLYLWQTKVTDAGAAKLQKALPELVIDRGWSLGEPAN